ncbi:basic blue protein-like [Impatiens glandulifera]|uniref:basic blue protein-like n=1 Tax=Impatiens glandulifera TaxID=253017 RepID=UPI001FB0631A|nr:basic blue protein-like [Impatiens glandulifera]
MLSRGRDNAFVIVTTLFAYLLMRSDIACATTHMVGEENGWAFDVVDWPKGKSFQAGDVLAFNYNPMYHNVVGVNQDEYDTCNPSIGSKLYTSGNELITLVKGPNYFICSFPGHCESNMKIAVIGL